MSGLSAEAIAVTQRFWEERTGERVSKDEAGEAIGSVAALFDLLASWDDADSTVREPDDGDA